MLTTLRDLDPTNPNPQVVATRVIGTRWVVYGAYQLDPKGVRGGYSTFTTGRRENGEVVAFGRLGTETLPPELDALKGDERYEAATAWQRERYQHAYDVIASEVEIPADAQFLMGEVETIQRPCGGAA